MGLNCATFFLPNVPFIPWVSSIPASRVGICVGVTSTVVFPWPIPHYDPISIQKQGGLMCSGIHPTFFVVA